MDLTKLNHETPQAARQPCANHRLEIDPLRTPPVMICRSCGVVEALSNSEIRWPSGQVKPKRFLRLRSVLRRTLSLTLLLIFIFAVLWAVTRHRSRNVGRQIADAGSKLSTVGGHEAPVRR